MTQKFDSDTEKLGVDGCDWVLDGCKLVVDGCNFGFYGFLKSGYTSVVFLEF